MSALPERKVLNRTANSFRFKSLSVHFFPFLRRFTRSECAPVPEAE